MSNNGLRINRTFGRTCVTIRNYTVFIVLLEVRDIVVTMIILPLRVKTMKS